MTHKDSFEDVWESFEDEATERLSVAQNTNVDEIINTKNKISEVINS